MPFPEVAKVLYRKNPLDQVICQLRFPPILKIDAEVPAEFQERVRKDFPNFSETSKWNVELPPGIRGQVPSEALQQALQSSGNRNYEFSSEDRQWSINLTRGFVALTAKKYEHWQLFKDHLQIPLRALIDIYAPRYFSRLGLRYVDVIRRSALNLSNVDWSELLQPHISGILRSVEVGSHVKNFESTYEIGLSDGQSMARISTRFVDSVDHSEICYMIDSDFYTSQRTDIESATQRLDYFSVCGARLFRWCIADRLHEAMEPELP